MDGLYTQTEVNDAIIAAKNEVLAMVLNNPDATTNSITEVLALMTDADANISNSISEKSQLYSYPNFDNSATGKSAKKYRS